MNFVNYFFKFSILSIMFLIISAQFIFASDQTLTFTFDKQQLQVRNINGFDFIAYEHLELAGEIAAPQLPVKIVHIALPAGKEIQGIIIEETESELLDGQFMVHAAQPPQILSRQTVESVSPDQDIYASTDPYPAEIVRLLQSQANFSTANIGAIAIFPLQYLPAQKTLKFHSRIQIGLVFRDSERMALLSQQNPFRESSLQPILNELVVNPADIEYSTASGPTYSSTLSNEMHRYVIITADNLVSSFQPLADWKTRKGASAKIVTTSWIYANYTGVDSQEKIRNFIIDAYQNWGTVWVLLGGDTNIIPDRKAFAMDCEYGPYSDNYIPCDLYFSDLDGNWNADGNTTYGEIADSIDMYPDVFVGRAGVENTTEAAAFVNKVLTYEKNAPNGHETDMLFLAEILWSNPYTNSGLGKDHIDHEYVPAQFDPITKLYEALGNENYTTVMNALNAGQNIINHDGHAWYNVMGIGNGYLNRSDLDMLTNGPKYSILFTIGCWPAAIDYDCMAEHFLTNPNGGGVAFIGNSRYGWGSPGNPLYGYSDRFDQQFFKMLFTDNIYNVGNAIAAAKAVYVPFSRQENVYRWCEYEINLLGDPEMPVWTDTPRMLTVSHPADLPVGSSICQVTVLDGSAPVEGARVCLMQDTAVYQVGLTGLNGQIGLEVSTWDPSQPIHITVTAQNCLPYEGTISLISNEPYAKINAYATNGSAQGFIQPGDLVEMDVCVKNFGSQVANNVLAVLRSAPPEIVMIDSSEDIGALLPGDSLIISGAFSFQVGQNLLNGDVIHLESEISADGNFVWTDWHGVTAATPVISFYHCQVSDTLYGDGDGFAEPGERVELCVIAKNEGLDVGQNVSANLSSGSPYVTVLTSTLNFGNMQPDQQKHAIVEVDIDASCPTPEFPEFDLNFQMQAGYQFSDNFSISVGEFGFADDMESGGSNWTHAGTPDLWHLSTHRKHSGNYSWYCGYDGSHQYANYMNNTLESIPFEIGQNPELSFWAWYECPNYGTDGFYAEVNDGSGWSTLDFIGSGGALGTLNTGNDWLEYTYDLSHYPPGTTLTLRFKFVSDDVDVAEGVYIDDVKIHDVEPQIIVAADPPAENLVREYKLYQNYPNPFNPVTNFGFRVADFGFVKLTVYDIMGREVAMLVNEKKQPGEYKVQWDAREFASGIYLYRLQAGQFSQVRKMILMK